MSLLIAYTFNEQSATPADYSGNKQTGASANVAFVAGQNYGYACKMGYTAGVASYVSVTPINFNSLTALTIFTSFNLQALPGVGNKSYITYQNNSFEVYITHTGNIVFGIYSGSFTTVTSATAITTGWNTIGCVWDGTTLYIYINGVLDANTTAASSINATNNTIYIGDDTSSDTTNTLNAYVDCIEFRSTALGYSDIITLNASPGGCYIQETPNNFALGDIIADPGMASMGIVTWSVDVNSFYFYPLSIIGSNYAKIGNIYNPARQYYMETDPDFDGNGNAQVRIRYPIGGIADYASPADTVTFDYRGVSGGTANIANAMGITSLRI